MDDQALKEQELMSSSPENSSIDSLERTEPAYRIPVGAPIALPKNWEVVFDFLPDFEPEKLNLDDPEEAFRLFDLPENIWAARSVDKEWIMDLGWYPESDPKGRFKAVLIHGDRPENWSKPLCSFETRKLGEALDWIRSMLRHSFRP